MVQQYCGNDSYSVLACNGDWAPDWLFTEPPVTYHLVMELGGVTAAPSCLCFREWEPDDRPTEYYIQADCAWCLREAIRRLIEEAKQMERSDTERLDWIIKQGPPGAAEGIGLNEEAWDAACCAIEDGDDRPGDTVLMRRAIDRQMEAQ